MKQKNWFKIFLLLGATLMFFFACNTANDAGGNNTTEFTVKFSVNPTGKATLTAKDGTTTITSGAKVLKDNTVQFTLTNLDANYMVDKWNGENLQVAADKMSATLKVTKDATIEVILKAKPQEEVTLTYEVDGGNGKLEVKYGDPLVAAPASGQNIPKNSKVEFTATPDAGYEVESWTGVTGNPKQTVVTTTATDNLNVKVKFKQTTPSGTDWKITFNDIKVEKATETADKDKKRTVTFSVKYPEFTLPNPAPYIDSIISLEGGKPFPKDTKLTLKHTFVLKDGTEKPQITSPLYTVAENVTKIYGSKIYGESNPKKQLGAEHIGATEKYELEIELPSTATEDNYKILVKYALFTNDDETVQKELLDEGSFSVPGYGK